LFAPAYTPVIPSAARNLLLNEVSTRAAKAYPSLRFEMLAVDLNAPVEFLHPNRKDDNLYRQVDYVHR
jgi:hypothetical protein